MPKFTVIESTRDEEGELDFEPFTQEFTNLSEALSAFRSAEANHHSWDHHVEASCYPLCTEGHACWLTVRSRDMHTGENHEVSFHVDGLRSPFTRKRIIEHMLGPRP